MAVVELKSGTGAVVQVIGPVVDVEFTGERLPRFSTRSRSIAATASSSCSRCSRAWATDGANDCDGHDRGVRRVMLCAQPVRIQVPVGEETLGGVQRDR